MSYFLICGSEDGTRIVKCADSDELNLAIKDRGLSKFRDSLGDSDTNYWGEEEALVIKGDVIVPKPKQVVTDWDV